MIQINLLPDVKREYLHSQQVKHTVVVLSILASVAMFALLALLFIYVQVLQPHHRSNIQKDIDASISTLKKKQDTAVKVVTVQGALEQLSGLQDKKLITSRLFDYLKEFTPNDVVYDQVTADTTTSTLTLQGETSSYQSANVLANNLKSAKFSYKRDSTEQTSTPFSAIVFSSLNQASQTQSTTKYPVSFQLTFQFDPVMFDEAITDTTIKVDANSEQLLIPSAKPFNDTAPTLQQSLIPGSKQ